jgi:hypothetical protein
LTLRNLSLPEISHGRAQARFNGHVCSGTIF